MISLSIQVLSSPARPVFSLFLSLEASAEESSHPSFTFFFLPSAVTQEDPKEAQMLVSLAEISTPPPEAHKS